jgi:hypothetical protein
VTDARFDAPNLAATLPRVTALRPLVPQGSTLAEVALRFVPAEVVLAMRLPPGCPAWPDAGSHRSVASPANRQQPGLVVRRRSEMSGLADTET